MSNSQTASKTQIRLTRISQVEFHALVNILDEKRDEFVGRWASDIIPACSKLLGRPVAKQTINTAAEVAGVALLQRVMARPVAAQLVAPFTRGDVILAKEMIRVMHDLGIKPSPEIFEMASMRFS